MNRSAHDDLKDLCRRFNPLMLRDGGFLEIYAKPADCYYAVLQQLYISYPLGFVDMWDFMYKHQCLTPAQLNKANKKYPYIVIPTWEDTKERNDMLRFIVERMQGVTNLLLEPIQWSMAIMKFNDFLERQLCSENKSKLLITYLN